MKRLLAAVMVVIVSFSVPAAALAQPMEVPVLGYIGEATFEPGMLVTPTPVPPDPPSTPEPPPVPPEPPIGGLPTDPPSAGGTGSLISPRTGDDADITPYLLTLLLAIILLILLWWRRDEKPLEDG